LFKQCAILAIVVLAAVYFVDVSSVYGKSEEEKLVPEVQVVTVEGDTLALADLCGDKPTFLYLWATWCKVCSKDMKDVFKLREKFGDRVKVVGIAYKNSPEEIETYFSKKEKRLKSYIDADGSVFQALDTNATPTVVIVDASGKILFSGYDSYRKYRKILEKALKS
jgi:thiol-disulfide isomerase/thioredoxin